MVFAELGVEVLLLVLLLPGELGGDQQRDAVRDRVLPRAPLAGQPFRRGLKGPAADRAADLGRGRDEVEPTRGGR